MTFSLGYKAMVQGALVDVWHERRSEPRKKPDQYHSAEFSFEGPDVNYQFRIWNTASSSMCVLVKENSEVLSLLKVGDTVKVKYYSPDSLYPSEGLSTVIRHITRNEQGRFKGHFLVGLEILPQ
ncbi:MAG: hypothetical protein AB1512_28810 [Thermodesulfobacteriota bacterium]